MVVIKSVQKIVLKGGKNVCEDFAGESRRAFWVIDGASGIGNHFLKDTPSDAFWFASSLDLYLRKHADDVSRSLKDILKDAIREIKERYMILLHMKSVNSHFYPSSTIAMVRKLDDGRLEYFVLGDSSLYTYHKRKVVCYRCDDVLRDLDHKSVNTLIEVRSENPTLPLKEARKAIDPIIRANRGLKNRPGGYYILSDKVEAVDRGLHGYLSLDKIESLLLCSDGYSALIDTYHRFNSLSLFYYLRDHPLSDTMDILRKIERDDPEAFRYPRLKKGDDASALYIEF